MKGLRRMLDPLQASFNSQNLSTVWIGHTAVHLDMTTSAHDSSCWCLRVWLNNTEGKTGSATRRPVCHQNWKERCRRLEARTLGSCSPWWTHPLPHGQTASRCSPLQHSHTGFSHITQPHTSLWLQHSHTSPHDFNTAIKVLVTSTQSYKSLWL